MNKAVLNSLTEKEAALVREADLAALRELDEDQLLDLHSRVQRARTKHVKVYRRGASASVVGAGSRGSAHAGNQRARDKAEVFEAVLAGVSRQVSVVARRAAADLRADRVAAARAAKSAGPAGAGTPGVAEAVPSTRRAATRTTGGLKRDASSQAQGARRQAARDAG